MSDITTIARPYAKAIFNYALASTRLAAWSVILHDLAQATLDTHTQQFIGNPAATATQQSELLLSVVRAKTDEKEAAVLENLVDLLTENKRLLVLPDIYIQYEALRAEQEKTLSVSVSSFAALTAAQQQQLITTLSQRLRRQVSLEMSIDKSLLGGSVIRAGDFVIDGSVRGKLNKLSADLAA